MKRVISGITAGLLIAAGSTTAWAWGPKTRVAIVSTAARVLSKDSGANLAKLEKDIRAGASISPSELVELSPILQTNPVNAIETEMYLLQAVSSGRVDPYFAYRLGILGTMVAEVSSPLAESDSTIRDLYYSDVEGVIERVQLRPARRAQVDPASYFAELQQQASQRREMIVTDYRTGIGFKGVAGTAISDDASRSVNAVADVMQAVLRGKVVSANISPAEIRNYVVRAIQFYIKRGNDAETDAAYKRLMDLNAATPDLQKQIADMFYDAGKFDRAMKEYQAVLALDPARRDVSERIASYYVKVGDDALGLKKLEDARDSYQNALNADKLHPTAQKKLMEAEKMIQARDERLAAAREAVSTGNDKLSEADKLAFRREYGGAIALLYEAQANFEKVTDEFTPELRDAQNGLLITESKLGQLRQELVNNAPSLSGLGSGASVKKQTAEAAQSLNTAALHALIEKQYQAELDRLKSESAAAVNP